MPRQTVRVALLLTATGSWTACSQSDSTGSGSDGTQSDSTTLTAAANESSGAADETTGSSGGPAGLDTGNASTDTGGPDPDPGDPFDPPPPLPTIPDGALKSLEASIHAVLDGAPVSGTTQSVLIVDAETGQEIFARNPSLLLAPASNTKLLTTAIAMEALGSEHRLTTEIRADAPPDAEGAIAGDLHAVLHHDFTWSPRFQVPADLVIDRIAEDLFALGVRTVGGAVVVHGEAVYDGQQFATYNPAAHRTTIASVLSASLSAAGVAVLGGTATAADFEQPGILLYQWQSPPLAVAIVPTNTVSHNEFADVSARHVGFELVGESSYPAEEAAMLDWLGSIPTSTQGVAINDGSGLSSANRISAQTVVDVLDFMQRAPEGLAWVRSFAISGVRGTLSGRMLGPDVWGRVWGKTGTLTGVIATSGVLYNRYDGRRYLVSLLFNSVSSSTSARAAHDDIFEIIAEDHYGTTRPDAPVLSSVRAAESDAIEIAWSEVDGATGYLVWLSPDGKVWDRDNARLVQGSTHRAGAIGFGPDVFVRVTAVGDGGESDASDVYGSRAQAGSARVLLVDGFDRWQTEPSSDNPLGAAHDFVVPHGTAINGTSVWDACDNDAVVAGEITLSDYDAVVWLLGEESTADDTFDTFEQDLVTDYLDAGGSLFVSGAEIGWDLVANGDPNDAAFLRDVLRTDYISDQSGAWFLDGISGAFAEIGTVGLYTPGTLTATFTDQLEPAAGAEAIASYYGGLGGTAAVSFDGDYGVVVLGFPFSAIDNADDRATVMAAVLAGFGI